MIINIKTIPHKEQRYPTVGDFWIDGNNTIQVRVSNLKNTIYEQAVVLHELTEFFLCQANGINEPDIAAFDIQFEKNRQPNNTDEPGDDPKAPYKQEHSFATAVERIFIAAAKQDWKSYDQTVNELE